MPFDGIDPFALQQRPRRPAGNEAVLLVLVSALLAALLLLPISLDGFVDLVRYLRAW